MPHQLSYALSKPTAGSNGSYQSILKAKLGDRTLTSAIVENKDNTHALKYQILVSNSNDGSDGWFPEKSGTVLTANALDRIVMTGPFLWVDVQIESQDSGSPQASAWLLGVGL